MLVYHETHFCKSALFDMSAGTPIEIDRFVFGRSGLSSTGFRMHIRVEAADSLVLPGAEAANSYCPGSGSPVGLTRATLLNLRARKVHSTHHKKIHSKDSSTMSFNHGKRMGLSGMAMTTNHVTNEASKYEVNPMLILTNTFFRFATNVPRDAIPKFCNSSSWSDIRWDKFDVDRHTVIRIIVYEMHVE